MRTSCLGGSDRPPRGLSSSEPGAAVTRETAARGRDPPGTRTASAVRARSSPGLEGRGACGSSRHRGRGGAGSQEGLSGVLSHALWVPAVGCVSLRFASAVQFSSLQFRRSVVSDSLRPHEPQRARPPCPSPAPGVHPNPRPLSR